MKFEDYTFPSRYDEPFVHQVETVKFFLMNQRGFCTNTMGTGKTLSALWALDFLIINEKIKSALIIAPLSTLKAVWGQEVFEHLPHRRYTILHGSKAQRLKSLSSDVDYYIINTDGIKTIEKEIERKNFDVIVVDESTDFKTHTSERSKCLRRLSKIKGLWAMSGEPTPNSPLEAFSQARIVNPNNPNLPSSYYKYRDMVMWQMDPYTWLPRPGWEKIAAAILKPSIRYTLRECIDLPETIYEVREVALSKEQQTLYKQMTKDYMAEARQGLITAANAGVKYLKLLQISSGTAFGEDRKIIHLNCNNKLNELYDVFLQTEQRKLIVFALFRPTISRIEQFLSSKGLKVDKIIGGQSANKRGDIVTGFQKGDIDVLVIQPKAAAYGLTLTAANVIVWFTPPPTNGVYQQANARIVRPSQTRTQIIMKFHSSPSETRVYKSIDNQESMSNTLMDVLKNGE